MTLQGVDYSSGHMSAATAKKNGLSFICRYVSTKGAAKNLTKAEVDDWQANGIGIVVVFEQGANNPLGGAVQGKKDAEAAQTQLDALGISNAPVYFAVDFDATPAQLATVDDYLKAACGVLGMKRMGVYGGIKTVGHALDKGLVTYAWQTYAWSSGKLDNRAHIYQYKNEQKLGGLDVDLDRTVSSDTDYGQVPPQGTPSPAGSSTGADLGTSSDTDTTADNTDSSGTDSGTDSGTAVADAGTDTADTDTADTDTADTGTADSDTSDSGSEVAVTDAGTDTADSDTSDADTADTDTSDTDTSDSGTDVAEADTSDTGTPDADTSDSGSEIADADISIPDQAGDAESSETTPA